MRIIIGAVFCMLAFSAIAYGRNASDSFVWDKSQQEKSELIEDIPEYDSLINWTTGKVRSEATLTPRGESVNIGKAMNNAQTEIRDELRQNLIKSMGYVRISDVFLLKDYYSMKSDLRYEIISYADRAFFYPIVKKGEKFFGIVEMSLFGKNGIANLFFRSVEHKVLTNYVQEDSKDLEYFDGLIIDTITFRDFNPSIQMHIYDQDGILLYGPETVDPDALTEHGVCEYTTSLTYAFNSPRSGSRVYYTLPFALRGRMNTDFVMNNKDAARLFANPRSVKFLNRGQVVIVKAP